MMLFRLMLKNVWRNKVRALLTCLAVFTLVAIFSMILSVLLFLERSMAEKTRDIRTVMTERYRIPSRFDSQLMSQVVRPGYELNGKLEKIPGFHSEKHATWTFMAFSLDPTMKDRDKMFFAIATQPEKIPFMIDGLEGFDAKVCELVKRPPRSRLANQGILVGEERLRRLGRAVGDTLSARSISHQNGKTRKPIEMQFEVVGVLPGDSRWTEGAFIDVEYAGRVLDQNESELAGRVNLGWLMVDDQESTEQVIGTIDRDPSVGRELKLETGATAVGRFLEPYKDLLRGIEWLLMPAIMVVMTVVVASSISITVRERVTEIAVMKVLGFRRWQVLTLVLGEGILMGVLAGVLSGGITVLLVNYVVGGIKIPLGFFPVFFVPWHALWWGAVLGGLTALLGGILPAWNGTSVRVSEVFSNVT